MKNKFKWYKTFEYYIPNKEYIGVDLFPRCYVQITGDGYIYISLAWLIFYVSFERIGV
jgi:hypothetical protein